MRVCSSRSGERSTFISTIGAVTGSRQARNSTALPLTGSMRTSSLAGSSTSSRRTPSRRRDSTAATGSMERSSPSTVRRRGRVMIWFHPCVGLPGFMLKITIRPPSPSGVAEGACTPQGTEAPKLNLPPWVTTSLSRSVS